MKTIVALVDFSDVTPKVVEHTLEHARKWGSEVFLVHVLPPMPTVVDYGAAAVVFDVKEEATMQAHLQTLQKAMQEQHAEVSTRLFKGHVVDTLLDQLPALKPDLIVMGSHGHGAIYHLFVGSVTQGVIKHAVWPVMVIPKARPKEQQPAAPADSETDEKEKDPLAIGAPGGALPPTMPQ